MEEVKYFKVFGERNSGTNYLYLLIRENFGLQYLGHHWDSIFGWKHDIIDPEKISDDSYISKRTLFLNVYKNPYSWAISMHKKPHHMPHTAFIDRDNPRSFIDFLNFPWHEKEKFSSGNEDRSTITVDLRNYENLFKMRYEKLKSHLLLKDQVDYFYSVSYEDLLENPERIIGIIGEKFGLKRKEKFIDINFRCDPVTRKGLPYESIRDYYLTEKWKEIYNQKTRKVANRLINWNIENKLKYFRYDGV